MLFKIYDMSFHKWNKFNVETSTIGTTATGRASRFNLHEIQERMGQYKGKCLWEGRLGKITRVIVLAPWNMWFQVILYFKYLKSIFNCHNNYKYIYDQGSFMVIEIIRSYRCVSYLMTYIEIFKPNRILINIKTFS